MFLCFEGSVINESISHIKLPPRNVPSTLYKVLYVVLIENHRGICSARMVPMTKILLLAHPLALRKSLNPFHAHSSIFYHFSFLFISLFPVYLEMLSFYLSFHFFTMVTRSSCTSHLSRFMTEPTKWVCAERKLRSTWASAQSNQSLRCPHEES